ncbi:MAG: translation elongation factor Ts [Proteobacteria bacterium]|nr:translation elongation factor Ts [Pseudomonadota bacterium]
MAVTASLVKELRERTGLGMMDCKRALEETSGDIELAIDNLRKNSALKAAKKAGRTTADGLLGLKVAADGKKAAMVEVNIETDFAAKNEKFIAFVDEVLNVVFDTADDDLQKLTSGALDARRESLVQEIGENISVRRAVCFTSPDGYIASYKHGDDRKATLVELDGENAEIGRDIAMHVTAAQPLVVRSADVAPDLIAKEREIFRTQAQDSGKPAEIVEKMVEGRIRKYLEEVSLLDQPFVKDDKTKVAALLSSNKLDVRRFVRFEVGEGIDIPKEDFAAEVAAQVKGSQKSS